MHTKVADTLQTAVDCIHHALVIVQIPRTSYLPAFLTVLWKGTAFSIFIAAASREYTTSIALKSTASAIRCCARQPRKRRVSGASLGKLLKIFTLPGLTDTLPAESSAIATLAVQVAAGSLDTGAHTVAMCLTAGSISAEGLVPRTPTLVASSVSAIVSSSLVKVDS